MLVRSLFGLIMLGAVAPAMAQDESPRETIDSLEICRALPDDADRLECYDSTLDEFLGVDEELQAKREANRRARFGLPQDSSGMQMTELNAIVTEVDENLRTRIVILALENGQVWQLLGSGGLRARFKPGMEVVISESGTGGYRLRVPGKVGFRGVERIR